MKSVRQIGVRHKRSALVAVLALIAALIGLISYAGIGTASADEPSCDAVRCSSDATLPDEDTLKRALDTGPNQAYFWTGRNDGVSVMDRADEIAVSHGGTTLEGRIERAGITMPEYDPNNTATHEAWAKVSELYAQGASGVAYVVMGEEVRENTVFLTKELPALQANGLVVQVVKIDARTGEEVEVLYERSGPPTDDDDDDSDDDNGNDGSS